MRIAERLCFLLLSVLLTSNADSSAVEFSVTTDDVANEVSSAFASVTIDSGELYYWNGATSSFTFDTPRLRNATRALTAANGGNMVLRVGGTDGDRFYYDMEDTGVLPEGFRGLLNTTQVGALIDFCAATGLRLLFALNGGPLARDDPATAGAAGLEAGAWNPDRVNAKALLSFVAAHPAATEASFLGWELGNEPNLYLFPSNGEQRVTGTQLAADFKLLRSLVDSAGEAWKVVGPDVAFQAPLVGEILPNFFADFAAGVCDPAATGGGSPIVDAFTWHWYPTQSTKKFPPAIARLDPWAASAALAVAPRTMDRWRRWQGNIEALAQNCTDTLRASRAAGRRGEKKKEKQQQQQQQQQQHEEEDEEEDDEDGPVVEAWVGEMALTCFGGEAGVTDSFAGVFWYADSLGQLAAGQHKLNLRQELIGAYDLNFGKQTSYGLLSSDAAYSSESIVANPDYFVTLLHRTLMSPRVLRVGLVGAPAGGSGEGSVRGYAHCTLGLAGAASPSITALVLNLHSSEPREVSLSFSGGAGEGSGGDRDSGGEGDDEAAWSVYLLTAANSSAPLSSRAMLLNGAPLAIDAGSGAPPDLRALAEKAEAHAPITLPPYSAAFVVAPVSEAAALCA